MNAEPAEIHPTQAAPAGLNPMPESFARPQPTQEMDDRTSPEPRTFASRPLQQLWILSPLLLLLLVHTLASSSGDPDRYFGFDLWRIIPVSLRFLLILVWILFAVSSQAQRSLIQALRQISRVSKFTIYSIAASIFLFLRCQNFYYGDTYMIILEVGFKKWIDDRHTLDVLVHAGLQSFLGLFYPFDNSEISYVLLSCVAGLVYLGLPFRMARNLGLKDGSGFFFAGMMLTLGSIQLFFGYIEHYTLVSLFLCFYMNAAICALNGTGSLKRALILGWITIFFHLEALYLMPSMIYLVLMKKGVEPRSSIRLAGLSLILPFVAAFLLILFQLHGLGGPETRIGGSAFLPWVSPGPEVAPYSFLSGQQFWAMLNLLFLIAPLASVLVLTGRVFRTPSDPAGNFLGFLMAGSLIFLLVWNPFYGPVRDWDLFSMGGFPLTAWAAYRTARSFRDPADAEQAACLYPLTAILLVLPWILENSVEQFPP